MTPKEINELVAKRLGWKIKKPEDMVDPLGFPYWHEDIGQTSELPSYSTDISAAWEVVEEIGGKKSRQWYLCTNFSSEFDNQIYVQILDNVDESENIICSATADTAPLAICRAALLSVESIVSWGLA